jgi:hypothetical protein
MLKPIGTMTTINFRRGERKRKERMEKEKEEETCAKNQQKAHVKGYCCHQHAKVAKKAH